MTAPEKERKWACVYTYVLVIVLNKSSTFLLFDAELWKILRQKWWAFNFCDFLSNSFVLFNFNFSTNSLFLYFTDSRVVLGLCFGTYRPTYRKYHHIQVDDRNRFSHFTPNSSFFFFLFLFSKNETMFCESLSKSMCLVILFR